MIKDSYTFRARYDEVDQMGYMYHSNFVTYCHIARTELMRKFGLQDAFLEQNGFMMPVIEMNLKYKHPVRYDEEITIETTIKKEPLVKCVFYFEFYNKAGDNTCSANSTIVFVSKEERIPVRVPEIVLEIFKDHEVCF